MKYFGTINHPKDLITKEYLETTAFIVDTSDGAIASFSDGADDIPVKSLMANIELEQSGEGDPSPSNVRPINGWTSATVMRTGKNLLKNFRGETVTQDGITFTKNADGSVTVNGTATANTSYLIWNRSQSQVEKNLPAGSYRLSGCPSGVSSEVYMQFQCTRNGEIVTLAIDRGAGATGTVLSGDSLQVTIRVGLGNTLDNVTFYPQLELGNITTQYEPYAGEKYSVEWTSGAGEVFGGFLDVSTGVLSVTHKKILLESVNQLAGFSTSATYGAFAYVLSTTDVVTSEPTLPNGVCSKAVYVSYNERNASGNVEKFRCWNDANAYVFVRASASSNIQTVEELFAAFEGAQIAYKLANPLTYQLTSVEVTTLLGKNNIWCSVARTGNALGIANLSVNYRADTKMYIDEKIAGLQALILENGG